MNKYKFTHKDIAEAMEFQKEISFDKETPIWFDSIAGEWRNKNSDIVHPNFSDENLYLWSFYKPKKNVKKTYYQAYILDLVHDFIYRSRYFESKDSVSVSSTEQVVEWNEKVFEIPE